MPCGTFLREDANELIFFFDLLIQKIWNVKIIIFQLPINTIDNRDIKGVVINMNKCLPKFYFIWNGIKCEQQLLPKYLKNYTGGKNA